MPARIKKKKNFKYSVLFHRSTRSPLSIHSSRRCGRALRLSSSPYFLQVSSSEFHPATFLIFSFFGECTIPGLKAGNVETKRRKHLNNTAAIPSFNLFFLSRVGCKKRLTVNSCEDIALAAQSPDSSSCKRSHLHIFVPSERWGNVQGEPGKRVYRETGVRLLFFS